LSSSAGFSTPDNMSEFYGYSASVPPTVTTSSSSSTNSSIYMTGTVNSDGGATITERGFYFGTSTNPTSNPKIIVSGTTGNFNFNKTGLSENTTYRYWAYATNSSGTTIGAMQTRATFPTLNYTWTNVYGSSVMGGDNGWQMESAINAGGNSRIYGNVIFYHPYLGGIYRVNFDSGYRSDYFGEAYTYQVGTWTGGARGDFRTRVQTNFQYTGAAYKSTMSDGYWSTAADGAFWWAKGCTPNDLTPARGYPVAPNVGYYHNVNQGGTYRADQNRSNLGYFWVLTQEYNTSAQSYNGYGYVDIFK
jgi:hypothetical protein